MRITLNWAVLVFLTAAAACSGDVVALKMTSTGTNADSSGHEHHRVRRVKQRTWANGSDCLCSRTGRNVVRSGGRQRVSRQIGREPERIDADDGQRQPVRAIRAVVY